MEVIGFVILLLVQNFALGEQNSSGDFVCPYSIYEHWHQSSDPCVYYICKEGELIKTYTYAAEKCFDASKAEIFNTRVYEPPETEAPIYYSVLDKLAAERGRPLNTVENIALLLDIFFNDFRSFRLQKTNSESSHEGETTLMPEEKTSNENIELSTESKPTESCDSNLECGISGPTTELFLNLDQSSVKKDSSIEATIEVESVTTPTIKSNSSEKLKEFTREVTIPIIQDIVDDPSKMSKVAKVFRKYFQAVVPLAADIMEQSEEHPGSGFKLQRKTFVEALRKMSDASPILKEAASELLPSILFKLSNHTELLLETIEETSERFQINFLGLLFRSFMFLLKSSAVAQEKSVDEFVEFPAIIDIRKDIEAMSEIVTEVTQDKIFYENINTAGIMLQLLFF